MVGRPNATPSWTLRFIKTNDRPLYFRSLCFCFDGYMMIILKSIVNIFCFYFILNQVYVVSAQ